MNNDNLRPLSARAKSEQREIARKGWEKSAQVRKERAQAKERLKGYFDIAPMTEEEITLSYQCLLSCNEGQLKEIEKEESLPVCIRNSARLMLSPDDETAIDEIERVLDRVFGKPKQKTDIDARWKNLQPVVVANFGISEK